MLLVMLLKLVAPSWWLGRAPVFSDTSAQSQAAATAARVARIHLGLIEN